MPAAVVLLAVLLAALTAGCGNHTAPPEGAVQEEIVQEETARDAAITIIEDTAPEAAVPGKVVRNKAEQGNTKLPADTGVTPEPEKAGNRKPVLKENDGKEVIPTRQELPAEPAAKEKNEDKLLPDKEEKPVEEPDSVKNAGMQVEEQTIVVPGLEGTYRYLFLSDTHIITLNGEETQQQLDNALPRRDTLFLDAQGRKPEETFQVWMAYANEQKVDAVLLGGDIIDFPSRSNLDFLEENLEKLEMPVLYVPGNHDWTYPWEYMTEKGKNEYLTALAPFMRGTPAAQVLENEELVLLGVDDSSNQIDPAALETVRKAVQKGKPVIILQHVPFAAEKLVREAAQVWKNPVALGMGAAGGIYPNEASQEYRKLVLENAGPVKAVLAGHIHMRETDVMAENSGIVQYTAAPGYLGQGILLTVTGDAPAAVRESDTQEEADAG